MNNKIILFADPDTREVHIDFPEPEDGIPELQSPLPRESQHRLVWSAMNVEQRAHTVFWSNGTQERINGLIKDGRGAGLRQTLKWLFGMRIEETRQKTGFQYELILVSDRERWERLRRKKS